MILDEAEKDSRSGRYEIALAKFVWFHENALAIQPSLKGVRLSFALSDWYELAQKYPPALDAMQRARDHAAAEVLAGRDLRRNFQDLAALDRRIAQEAKTRELFETLDRDRPDLARRVFDMAEPALVAEGAYALANKYVDPTADIKRLVERYREDLRTAPELEVPEYPAFATKSFTHNASTLVAILAVNGRLEEAKSVAAIAGEQVQTEDFEQRLSSALEGVVPEPWP